MASIPVSCCRCGCSTTQNHAAKMKGRPAICKDCRAGDPAYVKAVTNGLTLVPRAS
jgi:hypothetical protein